MSPNLRSRDAYRDAAWDWGILDGCFGHKIKPSDLDGVVERKGHILIIEAKPKLDKLPLGQQIMLEAFSRKPGITVLIVWGAVDEPEGMWLIENGKHSVPAPTTLAGMRDWVAAWYKEADK